MAEYIDREYVLKCMEDSYKNAGISAEAASKVRKWLYKAPAADVRPVVRGKWTDGNGNPVPWDEHKKDCPRYSAYCSVCGEWLTASDEYLTIGNFCPNCGADMRPTPMSGANGEES